MMESYEVVVRAYELFNETKYSEAAALYEELIELEPEVKLYYWYLGLCLALQGQIEEAQITWWITIEENESSKNEFVEFLRKTAREFGLDFKRYDIAVSILEAGVGLELENIYWLTDLARFYSLSSRHDECIEIANQYRELAQDTPNQIFANHLILHSLLILGNQWQNAFALADIQIELIKSLIQNQPNNLTSADINRLFISTFFLPYIKDDPRRNRTLQNELVKLCQGNLQNLSNQKILRKVLRKSL